MATKVVTAVYASNFLGEDVTKRCQQILTPPNNKIPVNNKTFGDPDGGNKKYFAITYTVDGGQQQYQGAEEGQTLTVPPE